MTRHYANLTNGMFCPCLRGEADAFCRIQSTHCEQKRWGDVIVGAGPDLLMRLAMGEKCVVHDVSERPRMTRALWQGVPWIRYACERSWGIGVSGVASRSGMNVTSYAEQCYAELSDPVRAHLAYFGRWSQRGPVQLHACDAATGPAR